MTFRSLLLGAALAAFAATDARAIMGAQAIFDRVDANHDGTVTRAEVVAAAKRKYDLIRDHNGGRVTLLDLGGRLSKGTIDKITRADEATSRVADPDAVSREQYVEATEKAFDQAKFGKPSKQRKEEDNLTLGEMSAPSAQNLIDLLE